MKKALIACAAGALLVAPGATAKPDKTDRTNAAQECRAERGSTDATREAFRVEYGTNKNGNNAFGKCVSSTAKELKAEEDAEDAEEAEERKSAAKECGAERGSTDETREAFRVEYGTNKNGRNAFGKCVSQKASA